MERFILKKLLDWKNSPYRKPLILKGVRQVGKTWILKEFGRRYYENTAYFNFDENEEYKQFFETTKNVDRILQNLMMSGGQKIEPEKTLIMEVKSEANTIGRSLKKFKELFPDQVKLRVRFSLNNLKLDDDVLNIPLFMADQTDRLIGLAMEKRLI